MERQHRFKAFFLGILLIVAPSLRVHGFVPYAIFAPEAIAHSLTCFQTVKSCCVPLLVLTGTTSFVMGKEIKAVAASAIKGLRHYIHSSHASWPFFGNNQNAVHANQALTSKQTPPLSVYQNVKKYSVSAACQEKVHEMCAQFNALTFTEKCSVFAQGLCSQKEQCGQLVEVHTHIRECEMHIEHLQRQKAAIENNLTSRWWHALKEMASPSAILKELQEMIEQCKRVKADYEQQLSGIQAQAGMQCAKLECVRQAIEVYFQTVEHTLKTGSLADLSSLGAELKTAHECYKQALATEKADATKSPDILMLQHEIETMGNRLEQAYQKTISTYAEKIHTPEYYTALEAERSVLQTEPTSTVNQARIAALDATINKQESIIPLEVLSTDEQKQLAACGIPCSVLADPYQAQLFGEQRASAHAIEHCSQKMHKTAHVARSDQLVRDALTHLPTAQLMQFLQEHKGISGQAFVDVLQHAITTVQQDKEQLFCTVENIARTELKQSVDLNKNGAVVESRKYMDYVYQALSVLERIGDIDSHVAHLVEYIDAVDNYINESFNSFCNTVDACERQLKKDLMIAVENSVNIPQVIENMYRGFAQYAVWYARASALNDRRQQLANYSLLADMGLCPPEPIQESLRELEGELRGIGDQTVLVGKALGNKWAQMNGPERLGGIVRHLTEIYLTGKTLAFAGDLAAMSSQIVEAGMADLVQGSKALGVLPCQELAVAEGMSALPAEQAALFEIAHDIEPLATEAHLATEAAKAQGAAEAKIGAEIVKDIEKIPPVNQATIEQRLSAAAKNAGRAEIVIEDTLQSLKSHQEMQKLESTIKELAKKTPDIRYGAAEKRLGWEKYLECLEEMECKYNSYRSTCNDIEAISKNTGLPKEFVEKIKNHIFLNEYYMNNNKLSKFVADIDMGLAWQRLIEGSFVRSDLQLLLHEYAEAIILKNNSNAFASHAHYIAQKLFNWENSL